MSKLTLKLLFLLAFVITTATSFAQTKNEIEVEIDYVLEERYVYYLDQNPEIDRGNYVDEFGVNHKVFKSLENLYKEIELGEFKLSDSDSRVLHVFSLDIEEIKRGRSVILIDTKELTHKQVK